MLPTTKITLEEFDHFVDLPENADNLFEYIDGESVEVPSNPYASYIAGRIFHRVAAFVEEHDLGYTTGEAGGYRVSGKRYAPNVGYISKAKQPELAQEGYNPNPPDLAVEIYAPGQAKKTVGIDRIVEGGDILPGFRLAVKDLFPK